MNKHKNLNMSIKDLYKHNVDYEWVKSKWNKAGRSMSTYSRGEYGLLTIEYIYGKNKLQIFYYNTVLFFRYLRRKMSWKMM